MAKDINTGDTQDTNQGETATYRDTIDNAGTYDNAGTVDLQDTVPFTTSASVSSSGWSVSVTHPESGRVIRPDVINPQQVQYLPGPNMMPRIRLPVRRAPSWLREEYDDNPTMSVHLDGTELPVGELVDVEQEEGQTILVGEGGSELRTVVDEEYDAERRPVAATDLVDANTSYATVDDTPAVPSDSRVVQDESGESGLQSVSSFASDTPLIFTSGGVKPAQTCFTQEAEDGTGTANTVDPNNFAVLEDFSEQIGIRYQSNGEYREWTFTNDYTIPGSDFDVYLRYAKTSDIGSNNRVRITLDGSETIGEFETAGDAVQWQSGGYFNRGTISDISPGSHTIRIEQIESGEDDDLLVDVVAPVDTRYSYTLDNTTDANHHLDGPELYPGGVDAVFDAYESAFSIVGGSVTTTINDTSNNQALALSNDRGASYPISGSNTTSVSGSFPSEGATLTLKATLSRYSPSGAQSQTPKFGYDGQRLDAYELTADLELESLLIAEEYGDSLNSVLNDILSPRYAWKVSVENGTTTVTVDEPGNSVASRDPEISDATVTKKVVTYDTVRVKGSALPVDSEEFQASNSYEMLGEDNIVPGSESVTDDAGTQYVRDTDYEMNWGAGEIKALSGGSLTIGDTYNISYNHKVEATHTVPSATGDTLVRTIPGVTSDRQAEQIAYVLAEVYPAVSTPRYEGEIVVPRLDAGFDPLEGLNLSDMDLPDVARPLSIRGEPELTPLGLTLRLGSAPSLEESLRAISEQVSAVSDRV